MKAATARVRASVDSVAYRWTGVATAAALLLAAPAVRAQDVERGRAVYESWCVECHGAEGRGDGPAAAYMLPRPRDFVQARYQVRTTGPGELPTDADLRRILRDGMPGTAMPEWPNLSEDERRNVIAYVKSFSPFFEDAPPEPMSFSGDPGTDDETLATGREVYERLECAKCHGASGRGTGQSTPTLEDWREFPIRAADLTEPWLFNGGMGPEAIHTRFLTGLDGTPMPAYSDALASDVVTEEELWALAHYVASLGPEEAPETRDLLLVRRTDGELPDAPDADGWAEAEAFYVPLVGQVVASPRQFAPTVDGVWIRGLHDGDEMALLLTWNDPSRSPDSAWDEWQARLAATLYSDEPAVADAPLADGIAVQYPPELPEGPERPYFLMGDPRSPVYLWLWESRAGVSEATGRGLGTLEPISGGELAGEATWDEGQWRLTLRRPLETEAAGGLSLRESVAVPVAFFAWDGSSAEDVRRGSISGWYYLYLEGPGSAATITVPLLVTVITAGLLVLWAVRARRRPDPEIAPQTA